ncbi:hypothetical protein PHSY_002831 [Pseudozyma hubeiensis SY62]|uniref:Uncharacterized protein n=1 Tax=Pseudozyma hubeiensis (strain SY62) TaxID=1305764 RepID=R9P1W4_PSEHS|nr:hypothetical protein PHSY_002831 [Pseudozyma hubeiensis SY62]GAC95256.1 hypothetical protein PHSY_002831 [Pseudozyma hubeiensis SY62]
MERGCFAAREGSQFTIRSWSSFAIANAKAALDLPSAKLALPHADMWSLAPETNQKGIKGRIRSSGFFTARPCRQRKELLDDDHSRINETARA